MVLACEEAMVQSCLRNGPTFDFASYTVPELRPLTDMDTKRHGRRTRNRTDAFATMLAKPYRRSYSRALCVYNV